MRDSTACLFWSKYLTFYAKYTCNMQWAAIKQYTDLQHYSTQTLLIQMSNNTSFGSKFSKRQQQLLFCGIVLLGVLCPQSIHMAWQSSLSYFPLFSWPAHPHCTQLDPRSRLTFQRGIWHQWNLGLLCYYLCLQILQHFVTVSIACCGKAWIFDCMNVGVFISPVSSFLKPVIHFRDSVP